MGKPTWAKTFLFHLSGQNPKTVNPQIHHLNNNPTPLNPLWNTFTFDFEGSFNNVSRIFTIDSGCSGFVFIQELAVKLGLEIFKSSPQIIRFANNNKIFSNQYVNLKFEKEGYSKTLSFQLIPNLSKAVMFGVPFFLDKLIQINWNDNEFKFQISPKNNWTSWKNIHHQSTSPPQPLTPLPLFNLDNPIFLQDQFPEIQTLCQKYQKLFGPPPSFNDIPSRSVDQLLTIDPSKPFPKSAPLRGLTPGNKAFLDQFLDEKLALGLIKVSKASYGSNIIIVDEGTIPNQKKRLVIDYRMINNITIKDKTPLVNFFQIKDTLKNKKFFSVLDISSAFHMIRMHPQSTTLTAFKTHRGMFEFLVCAMGLKNSPAVWTSLMYSLFAPLSDFCLYYMDDLLIASDTYEDHVCHLD